MAETIVTQELAVRAAIPTAVPGTGSIPAENTLLIKDAATTVPTYKPVALGTMFTVSGSPLTINIPAGTYDVYGSASTVQGNLNTHAGLTTTAHGGIVSSSDSRLSDSRIPTAHTLDGALHTISGKTAGHFLKALSATTFGFAAHGLTYTDVGAAASGHDHGGTTGMVLYKNAAGTMADTVLQRNDAASLTFVNDSILKFGDATHYIKNQYDNGVYSALTMSSGQGAIGISAGDSCGNIGYTSISLGGVGNDGISMYTEGKKRSTLGVDGFTLWSVANSSNIIFRVSGAGVVTLANTYVGTGIVYATNGVLGIATAGTDFAPTTTGTAILKGNGSGGFTNTVSGTDYIAGNVGTANVIAKFSASGVLANSSFINENATGVGIGYANPSSKLTIDGTVPVVELRSGGNFMLRPVSNSYDMRLLCSGSGADAANTNLDFTQGGAAVTPLMRIVANGNVGIGTGESAINGKLGIYNTTSNWYSIYAQTPASTGTSYGLFLQAGSNSSDMSMRIINSVGNTNYFTIRGDGNIGVGIESAGYNLDIQKPVCTTHFKSTTANVSVYSYWANNYSALIGIENTTGGNLITGSLANAFVMGHGSDLPVHLYNNNTPRLTIAAGGNVGVRTVIPDYAFDVDGHINARVSFGCNATQTKTVTMTESGTITPTGSYMEIDGGGYGSTYMLALGSLPIGAYFTIVEVGAGDVYIQVPAEWSVHLSGNGAVFVKSSDGWRNVTVAPV
jgi:hypothetical protein